MNSVLTLEKVAYRVQERELLAPLSLSLQAGEIVGLAGPNGAGKSTLLRVACGEYAPAAGRVLLHGRTLSEWTPRERAQHLAYLPQLSTLQFDFTVRQVVALGRTPHADRPQRREGIIERLLDDCDLRHLALRSYTTLSGGERQRVQLARVLAQLGNSDPDGSLQGQVLLLDEPTSALDISHQQQCLALLDGLRERGCAILLVMHDINLLVRCSDRLLLLRNGATLALGETDALLKEDLLSRLYDYPLHVTTLAGSGERYVHPRSHPRSAQR